MHNKVKVTGTVILSTTTLFHNHYLTTVLDLLFVSRAYTAQYSSKSMILTEGFLARSNKQYLTTDDTGFAY